MITWKITIGMALVGMELKAFLIFVNKNTNTAG